MQQFQVELWRRFVVKIPAHYVNTGNRALRVFDLGVYNLEFQFAVSVFALLIVTSNSFLRKGKRNLKALGIGSLFLLVNPIQGFKRSGKSSAVILYRLLFSDGKFIFLLSIPNFPPIQGITEGFRKGSKNSNRAPAEPSRRNLKI